MRATALAIGSVLCGCLVGCNGDGTGADTTPPSILRITPTNEATGVPIATHVVVLFSEGLDRSSVTPATVGLFRDTVRVPASLLVDASGRTVSLAPLSPLGNNRRYRFTITNGVKDLSGNALANVSAAPFTAFFKTLGASASTTDPTGDTYGTSASAGYVQPDITSLEVSQDPANLVVVLRFAATVQPSTSGGTNVVVGYVEFDIDQDPATGATPAIDIFRPTGTGSSGMGVEYGVILFLNPDGTASVYDINRGTNSGFVTPVFSGNSLTLQIPYALLGNADGGVNVGTVLGTVYEPTDIAPNVGHLTVGTPGAALSRTEGSPRLTTPPWLGAWRARP